MIAMNNLMLSTESIESIDPVLFRERHMTDEVLLKLCASGNSSALSELFRRHREPIYRFLKRTLGSEADADDAVQELFVRVWKHAASFRYQSKAATWLYRIARNMAIDMQRDTARRSREGMTGCMEFHLAVESAEAEVLRNMERDHRVRLVRASLVRLSHTDRSLLIQYYLQDRSYAEIQAATGLSYKVLKARLARARVHLRSRVEAKIAEQT